MPKPTVIDADGHVMEYEINWKKALPPSMVDKGLWALRRGDKSYYPEPIVRETEGPMGPWHTKPERSGMWDPHKRIGDMDLEGVDTAVLFGGGVGLGVSGLQDWRLAEAMARGYNDWLANYCSAYPNRLKGAAALPMQNIEAAVKELNRCVKDYGFVGACVPVNVAGKNMDDPDYTPFYEAAQNLAIPVCIHNTVFIDGPGGERFTSFVRQKAILDPFEMMIASMSIVLGGVYDKFPTLKIAFLESGVGWVPYWMDRLEDYYEEFKELPLKHDVKDYFRSPQFSISCEVDEKTIAYVAETIGDDRIMYASDYLHHDCKFPESVNAINHREELSPDLKAKILGGNAHKLFNL